VSALRLAFLGCGFATRLHSRTLARFGDIERWYASRDLARAGEYSRKYSGAGWFGSYDDALRDERIDAVLVATPPASHLDLTLAALGAGKHVIVEKPPFLRSGDFDAVDQAARDAGRRVFIAENYFYKPTADALRKVIASGDIGEVRIININALKRQETSDWRDSEDLAGGGALFEGGIHWISFMSHLGLGVTGAHGFRAGGGRAGSLERSVVVVLEYAQGAVGTLHYSWEITSPLKGLRLSAVYGTEGTVTFESNGVFVGVRGLRKRLSAPGLRDMLGYRAMFEDFFRSIKTGEEPRFGLPAARRDLELVEQAYRSMKPLSQESDNWI
jgi:predicted dehydrogenase